MGRPKGERRSAEHEGYVATWRIGPIIAESSRTHVHNDSLRGQHARMPPEESPMSVVAFTRLVSIMAFAVAASVATLASANAAAQASTTPKNRVVMQVSDADPGKWNLALNNARNLQADLGAGNVAIEIVAYGPGIGMLKSDSVVATRIGEALGQGVKLEACENTMRGQKLTKADMIDGIDYVPAGVVEIMQKQQQGWAYLRP
jgi:intracellular sulfur oxidation DsrE/DsrF family protein